MQAIGRLRSHPTSHCRPVTRSQSGPVHLRIDPGNELSLTLQLTAETIGEFAGSAMIRSITGEILQEFSVYGRVDPWVAIADDSGGGFTTQGAWTSYVSLPGWFESSTSTVSAGDGQSYAEWRFEDLSAGTYQVAATWKPYLLGRAKNAPYEFWLDDQRVFQVRVNQRPAPDDYHQDGADWEVLADGLQISEHQTLRIRLSNNADGFVVADALRLERRSSQPPNHKLALVELESDTTDRRVRFTSLGETAFTGQEILRTVLVRNVSQEAVPLPRAPELPAGFTLANEFSPVTLQPAATIPITIKLAASSPGLYEGNVRFLDASDEPVLSIPVVADVRNVLIADNSDGLFSFSGPWAQADPYAGWYRDTVLYSTGPAPDGYAQWRFDQLRSGVYRLAVNWHPYASGRATDANYQVWLDDQLLYSLITDQRVAPTDAYWNNQKWHQLTEGIYVHAGQTLRVVLSSHANGFVVADAIRLEHVATAVPPLALLTRTGLQVEPVPNQVFLGLGGLPTLIGRPVQQTFTFQNVSGQELRIDRVDVPSGFRIAGTFDVHALVPAQRCSSL